MKNRYADLLLTSLPAHELMSSYGDEMDLNAFVTTWETSYFNVVFLMQSRDLFFRQIIHIIDQGVFGVVHKIIIFRHKGVGILF